MSGPDREKVRQLAAYYAARIQRRKEFKPTRFDHPRDEEHYSQEHGIPDATLDVIVDALLAYADQQPAGETTIRDAYDALAEENEGLAEREFCVRFWRRCELQHGIAAPEPAKVMAFMGGDDGFRGETDAPLSDEQLDAVHGYAPAAKEGEATAQPSEWTPPPVGPCVGCSLTREDCERGRRRTGDWCCPQCCHLSATSAPAAWASEHWQRRVEELERARDEMARRVVEIRQALGNPAGYTDGMIVQAAIFLSTDGVAIERTAREAAERERDRLRQALYDYGHHLTWCAAIKAATASEGGVETANDARCDCGLTASLGERTGERP